MSSLKRKKKKVGYRKSNTINDILIKGGDKEEEYEKIREGPSTAGIMT